MSKPKRNAFAFLGWILWKILALVGLPFAKKKIEDRNKKS